MNIFNRNAHGRSTDVENGAQPGLKEQTIEIAVFNFLIVPSMVFSFFAVKMGNISFVIVAVSTIMRDLALVSLILFFLWRNGESVYKIGWTFKNVRKEAGIGALLFIPMFFAASLLESFLHGAGLSEPSNPMPALISEKGPVEFVLAFLMVVVVAVAEETIFRGYLLLRFRAIMPGIFVPVILSAAIFSLGHGYEGTAGAVTVGFIGAVFALIYLWRKSLTAPVVMHFLQDFAGIVLIPLLKDFKVFH
jgi:membrane protease YdiL (CAAX protease family)